MSPTQMLYGRVIEKLVNMVETIRRTPQFQFYAFIHSILGWFKRD